ncbi:MAG: DUF4363 family protein [Clostridiales bacterium]|jgi:hypothetical protein|nr:DUF4363 family protein [Clostridiales bacterium]
MKQAKTVALILFVLVIAGGIAEQVYVNKTFSDFQGYISYFEEGLNGENLSSEKFEAEKFEAWWERQLDVIESLAHSRDIKTATQEIARLRAYITVGNAEEARVSLIALEAMGNDLKELLTFSLKHVI